MVFMKFPHFYVAEATNTKQKHKRMNLRLRQFSGFLCGFLFFFLMSWFLR